MSLILIFALMQPAFGEEFHIMKREQFLQTLKQEGKKTFCSSEGMLNCYSISKEACQATYESGFLNCQKTVSIPKQISVLGQDEKIESELGECIGLEFGRQHSKKFKAGSKCAVRK